MGLASCFLGLFIKLISLFKQLLCFLHIKRRRKNSGSLLPMHADLKAVAGGEVLTSLPSNDVQMASWDTWGDESESDGNAALSQHHHQVSAGNSRQFGWKQPPPDPEPETDYFQELNLEPSIRKTPKILVRKKEDGYIGSNSNRFAMTSDIPIVSGELGLIDESNSEGWADEDLSGEAVSAIRETRRAERVSKIAEHQQRKKDTSMRAPVGGVRRDKLSAVKLS